MSHSQCTGGLLGDKCCALRDATDAGHKMQQTKINIRGIRKHTPIALKNLSDLGFTDHISLLRVSILCSCHHLRKQNDDNPLPDSTKEGFAILNVAAVSWLHVYLMVIFLEIPPFRLFAWLAVILATVLLGFGCAWNIRLLLTASRLHIKKTDR